MSAPVVPVAGARFEWANMARGAAALAVVLGHFGVVFWMAQDVAASLARRPALYPGAEGAPLFARGLAAVPVDLGAFGVALFFLVSGFVIAVSIDRYSRPGFLVGRLMRILPTYAAGYLVTCAVVWAMSDPGGELTLAGVLVGCVPGLGLLLGVPTPADGIVWTLIIEFVFYGVCLVAFRRLTRGWVAVVVIGAGCVAAQLLLPPLGVQTAAPWAGVVHIGLLAAPFIPLMLVGVVLSARRRGQMSGAVATTLVPALLLLHTVLLWRSELVRVGVAFQVACLLGAGVFLLAWRLGDGWGRNRVAAVLADLSYPLYVVHAVLGYAVLSVLAGRGVPPLVCVPVAVAVALTAAWVLHRLVEVPTHQWGRRWARAISGRPPTRETAPEPVPVAAAQVREPG